MNKETLRPAEFWARTRDFLLWISLDKAARGGMTHYVSQNCFGGMMVAWEYYGAVHLHTTNFVQWPNQPMKFFWCGSIPKSKFWPANRANGGEVIVLGPNNCVQTCEAIFWPFCSCNWEYFKVKITQNDSSLCVKSQLASKMLDFDPFLVPITNHLALMAKSQASIQNISLSIASNKNSSSRNVPLINTNISTRGK